MTRLTAVLAALAWCGCTGLPDKPRPQAVADAAPQVDAPPAQTAAPALPPSPGLGPELVPTGKVEKTARVIIVGGGLAGLVTAYELEKAGISSHVIEASDTFGGRVATAYYGEGLYAEYGMQEMWEDNPILGIAKEIGVAMDGNVEEPLSSVIIDGKIRPYIQDSAGAYLASFMSPDEVKALNEWMDLARGLRKLTLEKGTDSPDVKALLNLSFADWVKARQLPHVVSEFIRLTIECELAAGWHNFSALIGLVEFGTFLGKGMPNFHAKGGNIKVIEGLVKAHKGPETLGATVSRVDQVKDASGKVTAVRVTYIKAGQVVTVEGERAVLAVPFWRLPQIVVNPPLSPEKWQGIQTMQKGAYTVVHFLVDKAAHKTWEVNGQSPFPILSDGQLGVIYGVTAETPPSQPYEVFILLIYGEPARAFHMVPRENKLADVRRELDKYFPGLSGHIHGEFVYSYHPSAIAVWPPGRSPSDDLGKKIRQPEGGLYLAGDWTISGHSTGAVESGVETAHALKTELVKK